MKFSTLALLLLSTLGTAAQAQESARTREDVLRELAEARRMGDLVIAGCGGGTYREAFPDKYPSHQASTPPIAPRSAQAQANADRRARGPVDR